LTLLKGILTALDGWFDLVPHATLLSVEGDPALHAAARARDSRWILAYLGEPATVRVHLDQAGATGAMEAAWISPSTGERLPGGSFRNQAATPWLTPPPGWEDALLLLERAG
ncbi:MAG: putative collagen-binding domain-containing protein, partial [Armatimonadota bacterium]|nr:putative collagen-binding domain-containing protein [Armatimonadota bacterium]